MISYSKKNTENFRENAFDEKKKKRGLKFNPGLVLEPAFKQLGPG